jgi:Fe-S-cluster containining protein
MKPMSREQQLVQIVDAALAEANRLGGAWIACRPGCTQCCLGVFAISELDGDRLREGMRELERTDPARAARVRQRAAAASVDEEDEDQPCPALDPEAGTCDLYAWRPLTCRTFGPAIRVNGDSVDVCELCFEGATEEQIVDCSVDLEVDEEELAGETFIATVLRDTQR